MRILLDTHVWLWMLSEPDRLADDVQEILADPRSTLHLSVASAWEIAIKFGLGKLPLPEPPATFVPSRLLRDGVSSVPIEQHHVLRVAELPHHHRDPFDRLLVAQAKADDFTLFTVDQVFGAYDLAWRDVSRNAGR